MSDEFKQSFPHSVHSKGLMCMWSLASMPVLDEFEISFQHFMHLYGLIKNESFVERLTLFHIISFHIPY